MASYTERVVRSLSADELDSAVRGSNGGPPSANGRRDVESLFRHTVHQPHYPPDNVAQPKERRGLLKRIRNAFRSGNSGGTASSRPGRFEKGGIRPTIDILPEDHLSALNGHHRQYPPYPGQALQHASAYPSPPPSQRVLHNSHLQPLSQHPMPGQGRFEGDPPSDPRFGRFGTPGNFRPQPASDERATGRPTLPKAKTSHANSGGRGRSWRPGRGGDSVGNLTVERQGSELSNATKPSRFLGESKRNRASTGIPNGGTSSIGRGPHAANGPHNSPLGQQPRQQQPYRSLPKRVFSSPPSLSARSFVFGSRKRSSASSKSGRGRSSSALGQNPGPLGTGAADPTDQRKLSRSFGGRQGVPGYYRGGSMNMSSVGGGLSVNTPFISPDHNAEAFKFVVEAAVEGKASFSALLDAMFRLEERLPPETKDILIKYLSRQDNIEALIDRLTVVLPILADDDGVEEPGGERVRYRHSYVSSMLLSNGPISLRRCLFSNGDHLDRLVGILQDGSPTDPVLVRSICKVLLSVLRDSPNDTIAAMMRRRDFLSVLLSHIAVTGCPEVCLSMLSTVRCQQELKFGPPNKPVVCMMADAKLLPTLCDKLASAAEDGPLTSVASATIENCSRVIVGIALRALVINRYEINDVDDMDTKFMIKFNKDLASLDVFNQPMPILRVLDSGFAAMTTHDERGYALATALTAVRYMLVTVINGQDSSLSTIRLQLDTLNTGAYEAGVRARIPMLARVLQDARSGVSLDTMWDTVEAPLGVVRLKILELLVVLLQHGSERTANAIVDANIPKILIELFNRLEMNSLLQHMVATMVDLSFVSKSCERVRRAFLLEGRLLEVCMGLWNVSTKRRRIEGVTKSNRCSDIVRMCRAAEDFFRDQESPEVQELMGELGDVVGEFNQFCETEIAAYLRLNVQLLGGAEHLPRRMDDGFGSFEGLGFGSGGQGSLYFRSRAAGAVGTT